MSNLWVRAAAYQLAGQAEPEPETYYHGTTNPRLRNVFPANRLHRSHQYMETDRNYAYATKDPEAAWHYAEKAWNWNTDKPWRPRVYEVAPHNPYDVEVDPPFDEHGNNRSTFAGDRRSRSGFRVIRQLPFPDTWGDPEDWDR